MRGLAAVLLIPQSASIAMLSIPRDLLRDVYWSFSEPTPQDPHALIEAAREYAAEIDAPDPFANLAASLPRADLRLSYTYGVRGESGEWEDRNEELRVVGTGGHLTGAELLWELHVACAATVGNDDHHFFEGLQLQDPGSESAPPLYEVLLGS